MQTEFGDIMQLGYIVEDIETAANEWAQRLNIGPFYKIDRQEIEQYRFRGQATKAEVSLAFAYWGNMQVELIQPLGETETLYTEAIKAAPGQLNHYATEVTGLDALLEKHQLHDRIIHSGEMSSGLKFVYLDQHMPGGQHLELVQNPGDGSNAAFESIKAVCKQWDGKDLIRSFARLGDDLTNLN